MSNDARSASATRLLLIPIDGRAGQAFRPVRVRLAASFNDGTTWHQVRLAYQPGDLTAEIANHAPGFVSLRWTVTDAQGDSTTETIYRAYSIR